MFNLCCETRRRESFSAITDKNTGPTSSVCWNFEAWHGNVTATLSQETTLGNLLTGRWIFVTRHGGARTSMLSRIKTLGKSFSGCWHIYAWRGNVTTMVSQDQQWANLLQGVESLLQIIWTRMGDVRTSALLRKHWENFFFLINVFTPMSQAGEENNFPVKIC